MKELFSWLPLCDSWFRLVEGDYIQQIPDQNGILHSTIFPGLWLDVNALLQDEMLHVLSILQQGIQSQEHHVFVQHLASRQTNFRRSD